MTRRVETVPEALAGQRLDRTVAMVTGVSRAEAAELVAAGAVRVGERVRTSGASRLDAGDELVVDLPDPGAAPAGPRPDPTVPVDVVHADDDVVVVDKPPGLVVHPGAGNPEGTLVNGLLARYPELAEVGDPERPGIVHRLDKDTCGLLVVARTRRAHRALVEQLSSRAVERRYLTLAWGTTTASQGVVDAPIGRSPRDRTRMAVVDGGRPARTAYEVVDRFTDPVEATLLRCALETGRTHQVRVHLAAIGHPVVGDATYGGERASFAAPRTFLHAARLGFTHPATGRTVAFDSPLPPDLAAVLDRLA